MFGEDMLCRKDWETLPRKSGGRMYVTLLDNVQIDVFGGRGAVGFTRLKLMKMGHIIDVIKMFMGRIISKH